MRFLGCRCCGRRRLPQAPQHIAHQLSPVFRLGQLAFDAQLVVAGELDMPVFLDQMHDRHRVDRRVFLEGDVDETGRSVNLDDAVGLGDHTQPVHVNQRLRLWRHLAKTVDQFFEQGVDLVCCFGRRELFVETEA